MEQGFDELSRLLTILIASAGDNVTTRGQLDQLCALQEKAMQAAEHLRDARLGKP